MKFKYLLKESLAAGGLIGLAAFCYTVCDNRYIGMLLFSAGLYTICKYGLSLYTGKVGYLIHDMKYHLAYCLNRWCVYDLILMFVFNIVTSYLVGCLLGKWEFNDMAGAIVTRFELMPIWKMIIYSFFCGTCMFLAVDVYKTKDSILGILFFVPIFLSCGFLHSVALPAFYGMIAEPVSWKLVIVFLMNGVGAIITKTITEKY